MHKIGDLLQIVYFSGYWNLLVVLNWVLVGLIVFIALRKKWSWKVRGTCLGLIAAYFTFVMFVPVHNVKTEKDERRAYAQEAYDYFHKKCAEDSGRFIYKPVETPQDSVYMMKPRKAATGKELQDQFWMGDPYRAGASNDGDIVGLVGEDLKYEGSFQKFLFIEMPDINDITKLWRYSRKPTGRIIDEEVWGSLGRGSIGRSKTGRKIHETRLERDSIDAVQSRYGFTWNDLSSREDRNYWVAKSRLQIVDLKTNEVVAERIGYVIEEGFGSKANQRGRPWSATGAGGDSWKRNYCPPNKGRSDIVWILSVLHNTPFE
ncbi:hypothetical protein AGMMS50225_04230 [Betaproteobacteria bacterium]|nr:hypothetical protein AGMMS50225_04230 [Betaproteobacteria bacterium]